MSEQPPLLDIAPSHPVSAQTLFKDRDELDEFWHEFYSKVRSELEHWDTARAQSEEHARNLWLRRRPPT